MTIDNALNDQENKKRGAGPSSLAESLMIRCVGPTHIDKGKEGKTSSHSRGARVDCQQAVGGAWGLQILII